MLKERQIDLRLLELPAEEVYLAMGYRGEVPDDMIQELVQEVSAEVSSICVPRYMYGLSEAGVTTNQHLRIGDVEFVPGGIISSYLSGMTQACLFVATTGKEYDAYLHGLKEQDNIVKEFVADALGTVIAEACVGELAKELDANAMLPRTLPYSPGYCGWNIAEQQKLFSFFPSQPCGVTLSESCLMSPIKSISGFFGFGSELRPQPYRCEICVNKHCFKRKERKI